MRSSYTRPDTTLGPPRYFLPVVKHPRDWQITLGPLGYVEVTEKEAAKRCPVLVEPNKEERSMSEKPLGNIRTFPLRIVLTVTTGRLLTTRKSADDNGIADLYDILRHMTRDSVWTHQLGRFAKECKPWLLRWYPQLSVAEQRLQDLDRWRKVDVSEEAVESWLSSLVAELGETFEVGQIPQDDHERKHPYDELVAIRGTDEGVIVVELPDKEAKP